jgi:hypothetical protein
MLNQCLPWPRGGNYLFFFLAATIALALHFLRLLPKINSPKQCQRFLFLAEFSDPPIDFAIKHPSPNLDDDTYSTRPATLQIYVEKQNKEHISWVPEKEAYGGRCSVPDSSRANKRFMGKGSSMMACRPAAISHTHAPTHTEESLACWIKAKIIGCSRC